MCIYHDFSRTVEDTYVYVSYVDQLRKTQIRKKWQSLRKAENPWKWCSAMDWWFCRTWRCGGSVGGCANCVRWRVWPGPRGRNPCRKGSLTPVSIESFFVSLLSNILLFATSFGTFSRSLACDTLRRKNSLNSGSCQDRRSGFLNFKKVYLSKCQKGFLKDSKIIKKWKEREIRYGLIFTQFLKTHASDLCRNFNSCN